MCPGVIQIHITFYTAQNKYECTRLFAFFRCFKLIVDLKNYVYALKACPILYQMVGKTIFFVTIMTNVTAFQPASITASDLQNNSNIIVIIVVKLNQKLIGIR